MKKVAAVGIAWVLILVCCFAVVAQAASASILFEDGSDTGDMPADGSDVTAGEEEPAQVNTPTGASTPAGGGAQGEVEEPAITWNHAVSLTSLTSPYALLVNREHLLDENFEPVDRIKMTVKRATSAAVYMERKAALALEDMFAAATEAGYTLFLKSGYRSYGTQKTTYENRLAQNNGKDDGVVAYPGSSEHQTGLSCDILNEDYAGRPRMTTDFSETAEAQWMKENCADFGFILRYPENATEITKIIFEPWHFRYVGRDVAGYIMSRGFTMEEFWEDWQAELKDFEERGGNVEEWMKYEANRQLSGPKIRLIDEFDANGDQEISMRFS